MYPTPHDIAPEYKVESISPPEAQGTGYENTFRLHRRLLIPVPIIPSNDAHFAAMFLRELNQLFSVVPIGNNRCRIDAGFLCRFFYRI